MTNEKITELTVMGLLVDTAFGVGGLHEGWGLSHATRDGEPVLLFVEHGDQGMTPLAELHPPRDGYEVIDGAGGPL